MKIIKFLSAIALTAVLAAVPVRAETQITTIESQVRPVQSSSTTVYKVTGPEKTEYRIQASPTQLSEIETVVKQNPNVIVKFDGELVPDESGNKVFRVTKWNKSTTVTNTVESSPRVTTETRTETIR